MKKFSLIAIAAVACWGMTSCDPYTLPNPPAQVNPDLGIVFNSDDLKVTNAIAGDKIDLIALNAAQQPVEFITYTVTDFPAEYNLTFVAEFAKDETFAETSTITCTTDVETNTASATAGTVQRMYNGFISKDPASKEVYVRYAAYAVQGATQVRLGGPDNYYCPGKVTITPMPQENLIEDHYYLVGTFNDWKSEGAIELTQLEEGSVYDFPNFQAIIYAPEGTSDKDPFKCAIIGEAAYKAGNLDGALGFGDLAVSASNTTGNLLPLAADKANAYSIKTEGSYMVKVNMETRKFEVMLAFSTMWVPANSNGTSTTDFNVMQRLTTTDYIHYDGTVRLTNQFWFTGQANLHGVVYRPDGDATFNEAETEFSGAMMMDNSGSTKMKAKKKGLYYITVDINKLTYNAVMIPEIDLIGGFNGWKENTSLPLTPDANMSVWTISNVEMPEGEYKFCVSKAWDYSYGIDEELSEQYGAVVVKQNAGNFNITEAGVYDFKLDFSHFPSTLTVTKK